LFKVSSESNPITATGTWTMEDSTILADYTYDNSGSTFSLKGSIEQDTTEAIYARNWFSRLELYLKMKAAYSK